jgi:hypothetical protein
MPPPGGYADEDAAAAADKAEAERRWLRARGLIGERGVWVLPARR